MIALCLDNMFSLAETINCILPVLPVDANRFVPAQDLCSDRITIIVIRHNAGKLSPDHLRDQYWINKR